MFNLKNILIAALVLFTAIRAEAAIVTDKMPLQCYVDHKVTSYDTRTGQSVGWIDADVDLVQITFIDGNGVAKGTHPSGSRRVERLFWAHDVFADTNYANRTVHVSGSHKVFRTKSSSSTIGSIANEDVTVVADNGNRAQIVYRLNNGTGYKMGWVPSSIVVPNDRADFRLANYNLSCPADHQLNFTGRAWNANNNSERTGIHVYIGGGAGAGGDFMGEFGTDQNHNFNSTLNVPSNRSGNQLIVIYAVNGKDAKELDRRNINVSPSPGPSGDYDWPIPGCYRYSFRNNHSCRHYYSGRVAAAIDIAAPVGTDIYAPASGVIQYKGDKGSTSFGKWFEIRHDDGTITLYAHLSNHDMVWNGKRVNKGELIAKSGNTGKSTGPHLHFEMYNPDNSNMRPDIYFKARGVIGESSY